MEALIARCKEFCGNNRVTLHGEILIGNSDCTQLLVCDSESTKLIEHCVKTIEKDFPYLKVELVTSVAEVTIKLFAYQAYTSRNDFLNVLKEKLEKLLEDLYASKVLAAQVNIFGSFQTTKEFFEFRYLNKETQIDYKIITSKKLSIFYGVFNRKVQLVVAAVIILLILSPIIYGLAIGKPLTLENVLNYIPADHNALQ